MLALVKAGDPFTDTIPKWIEAFRDKGLSPEVKASRRFIEGLFSLSMSLWPSTKQNQNQNIVQKNAQTTSLVWNDGQTGFFCLDALSNPVP